MPLFPVKHWFLPLLFFGSPSLIVALGEKKPFLFCQFVLLPTI